MGRGGLSIQERVSHGKLSRTGNIAKKFDVELIDSLHMVPDESRFLRLLSNAKTPRGHPRPHHLAYALAKSVGRWRFYWSPFDSNNKPMKIFKVKFIFRSCVTQLIFSLLNMLNKQLPTEIVNPILPSTNQHANFIQEF